MKQSKWMKALIGTACAAVISAGIAGSGVASAAPTQKVNATQYSVVNLDSVNLDELQQLLQKLLQQNGFTYKIQPLPASPSKPTTPQPKPAPQPAPKPAPAPAPKPAPAPTPQPSNGNQANDPSGFASEVVKLVNQERAKAGLKALSSNVKLAGMALDKAKDMSVNNYFDHNSPTYGSPFDMMKQYGISYSYAGENIAKGQRTPAEVMNGWMNSPGHRANILNANYTMIGTAYYNGHWVQEFIAN